MTTRSNIFYKPAILALFSFHVHKTIIIIDVLSHVHYELSRWIFEQYLMQIKTILMFCCSSGVKAMDKREGGGAHNWGNFKDDIEYVYLCYCCPVPFSLGCIVSNMIELFTSPMISNKFNLCC